MASFSAGSRLHVAYTRRPPGFTRRAALARIAAFLAANPAFAPVSAEEVLAKQGIAIACGEQLHLSPAGQDTDGFFAAVLERKA